MERLKLRIYPVGKLSSDPRVVALVLTENVSIASKNKKRVQVAYHIYVNSRPLLRQFQQQTPESIPVRLLGAYFAGRVDGDGCLADTPRISYTEEKEARLDVMLLKKAGLANVSASFYTEANTWNIYVKKSDWGKFKALIGEYSIKAKDWCHPVETAMAKAPRR